MKRSIQLALIFTVLFTYIIPVFAETPAKHTADTGSSSNNAPAGTTDGVANVPVPNDINSGACILIDGRTGRVLFEKDSKKAHMYPASTTKMMTGALACEMGDLEQVMTASKAAVNDIGRDGMNIGIMPDEQIKLENLLDALLISSANETANIIAENLCDTRQDFVDLMNQKAAELGCEGTHFVNPCGAHEKNHYTTAADLAKIARYAMTLPKFRETVRKTSYQMPPTNKHANWPVLYTTNKLMRFQKSDAPYTVIGIKTGYTSQAGNCLVSAAENTKGMELIAVVMNVTGASSGSRAVKYSKELYDYGFSNFTSKQVLDKGQKVQSVTVSGSADEMALELVAGDEFKYIEKLGSDEQPITGVPVVNTGIKAPVKQGDVLGYIKYEKDGELLGKIDLVASRDVSKKELSALENATKSVKSGSPFITVLIVLISALAFFVLLRITLKQVSRQLKAKRYRV